MPHCCLHFLQPLRTLIVTNGGCHTKSFAPATTISDHRLFEPSTNTLGEPWHRAVQLWLGQQAFKTPLTLLRYWQAYIVRLSGMQLRPLPASATKAAGMIGTVESPAESHTARTVFEVSTGTQPLVASPHRYLQASMILPKSNGTSAHSWRMLCGCLRYVVPRCVELCNHPGLQVRKSSSHMMLVAHKQDWYLQHVFLILRYSTSTSAWSADYWSRAFCCPVSHIQR
ncbi:hypothetical protein FB567DRAFT_135444 [Paraphoma chrysanthemicola]|uniref:Uncharacterized protein n=1 Tax=Paraphoma chrysanthemicola TaxID=798071 RepID=A0A8K0QXL3_9PLEO|nr:hypothetical protein FB567DRAFT_135444 [Paraphoma chrysanthemicola]